MLFAELGGRTFAVRATLVRAGVAVAMLTLANPLVLARAASWRRPLAPQRRGNGLLAGVRAGPLSLGRCVRCVGSSATTTTAAATAAAATG